MSKPCFPQTNFNPATCYSVPSPCKWGLTLVAVGAIGVGILGAGYAILGFTPLVQTTAVFAHLSAVGAPGLSAILITSTVGAGVGILILVVLHKPKKSSFPSSLELPTEMDAHAHAIDKVLNYGYSNYLELYGFYYHLASLTEHYKTSDKVKEWENYLTSINKKIIHKQRSSKKVKLDCSFELARLNDSLPTLEIESLRKPGPNEWSEINSIVSLAFDESDDLPEDMNFIILKRNDKLYVVRNESTNQILGTIILQTKNSSESDKPKLYIHTLARAPQAVKLGMTKKLKAYFEEELNANDYHMIYCAVLPKNTPAQYIYRKLGFTVDKTTHEGSINMVYQPQNELVV